MSEYPIGCTLDNGIWEITEALHGGVTQGVFRARRTDGHGTEPALVTLASPQRLDYARLHQTLAMRGDWIAELRYIGPLESEHGRYDGMVEDEPAGRPLRERVLTPSQAVDLAIHLCAAVEDAVDGGGVRGKLRPELIYVDDDGWLTQLAPRCDSFLATASQERTGIRPCFDRLYTAPEMLDDFDPASSRIARSSSTSRSTSAGDVFSVVAVLAELLSGEYPFEGDDFITRVVAMLRGVRRSWRGPASFAVLIASGLARDAAHRPQLAELATQLRTLRGSL